MSYVQSACFQPLTPQSWSPGQGPDRAVQRALRDSVADALGVESRGRGMHGLAAAIREKFANDNLTADDVPGVLETINRALDDAASELAAQGVSQERIDAGIAKFREKLAREVGALAGPPPAESTTPVEKTAIAAREVTRERFSLDVLTAEGDRVSIRFKSLNITEVAAAQVTDGENTATAVEANVISRGRFRVEVDGDLNEAERTAISDLLGKVEDIARDFFGGDVQAAFAAAGRVSLESEALSAFDLKMSYSRSFSAVQSYSSTARLGGASAPALPAQPPVTTSSTPAVPASSAAAAPAAPAVEPVTLPAAPQTPVSAATTAAPVSGDAATTTTPTSPAAASDAVRSGSALETITRFARDVLDRLGTAGENSSVSFSLRWKVEFFMQAMSSAAVTPAEQQSTQALGEAVQAQLPAVN